MCQIGAAKVGDLKAVLAAARRLVLVGILTGSHLHNGHFLVGIIDSKGDFTVHGGVVLPGKGTQVHGAVLYRLSGTNMAVWTGNTERTACRIRNCPQVLCPSILSYCHAKDQKHDFDDSV